MTNTQNIIQTKWKILELICCLNVRDKD